MALPPLNAIRAFEAVARVGSFKAAADALFVTQSAVSHQIRNFETWLGGPLFSREGNRTVLLPHGLELANTLSRALSEIDAACHHARVGTGSQPLVIAAIPSVAMCWLIPRLSQFRAAYPEIETRIVYAIHGYDIDFSDVHVAFTFLPDAPTGAMIDARFFLSGDRVPVCSPAVLAQHDRQGMADDFNQLGLLHDGDETDWLRWFAHAGHDVSGPLSGTTFEDFNLLRAAALSGQGVALCPRAMIEADLATGALVSLSDKPMIDEFDYYLITSKRAPLAVQAQIRQFSDWAMSQSQAATQ
ncbi:LysR substrate-binding domain-containing protein [Paracoccus tegillarcae]|uniref:LysR family transcriptional regulator n=1 Tax=Paracoccus tegillarcae TaxID=1529068 RepID=A0A2K9ELB4_9RHOB|nr:LysR substrate-binding domain-containing protein [Paracoccus tegillarcae]AUH34217.1 LysR family transcriptional regulator [Paracoccus tegillarcae]